MVQFIGLIAHNDGMTRVSPPLVANDNFKLGGEQVNEFPFGFISPLQTDNARSRHD
jgi:hypothetical protein